MRQRLMIAAALAGLTACASLHAGRSQLAIDRTYQAAVADAAVADGTKVASDLIAIDHRDGRVEWDASGARVLVVTWKSQTSYERFLRNATATSAGEANVVWVTAAPQVQQFCRRYVAEHPRATASDVALRLKQYLGLNAAWTYDVFVEMWVSPTDMFRPCVDPEIADSSCDLEFREPPPVVKGIADYPRFYRSLYFADFRTKPGVPWTGLGYTYDWGNPTRHEGASEFILTPGATYEIRDVVPTDRYCR